MHGMWEWCKGQYGSESFTTMQWDTAHNGIAFMYGMHAHGGEHFTAIQWDTIYNNSVTLMYTGCHIQRNRQLDANSHVRDNTYGTWMSVTIMYIRSMWIYNGMYIEVCQSEQGKFGHKTESQH